MGREGDAHALVVGVFLDADGLDGGRGEGNAVRLRARCVADVPHDGFEVGEVVLGVAEKVDIHRWARPRTSPYDKHLGALQDEPAGIVGLTEPEQEAFDGVSLEDLLEGRGLLPGDVLEPLTD